ncbi:hypothetical protein [Rhodobacter ferrooxidans]|uniref:hypothetical protein n=1 Tax=Rhodobacter ferrooxidans TaxID=371731 RepID=UPI00373AE579
MKARIVAGSLLPGVRDCGVSQKNGLIARHVSQWRRLARKTDRQDCLIAELGHALCGKRSGQLSPDERHLAFEDMENGRRRGSGRPRCGGRTQRRWQTHTE